MKHFYSVYWGFIGIIILCIGFWVYLQTATPTTAEPFQDAMYAGCLTKRGCKQRTLDGTNTVYYTCDAPESGVEPRQAAEEMMTQCLPDYITQITTPDSNPQIPKLNDGICYYVEPRGATTGDGRGLYVCYTRPPPLIQNESGAPTYATLNDYYDNLPNLLTYEAGAMCSAYNNSLLTLGSNYTALEDLKKYLDTNLGLVTLTSNHVKAIGTSNCSPALSGAKATLCGYISNFGTNFTHTNTLSNVRDKMVSSLICMERIYTNTLSNFYNTNMAVPNNGVNCTTSNIKLPDNLKTNYYTASTSNASAIDCAAMERTGV